MAIYHCSVKNISRSGGRSAVASASYRAGEKLTDQETGLIHDYTNKKDIAFSEIILCENAPDEFADRGTLWNSVQEIEKQSNARLAREWEVAIPNELTFEESKMVVHEFGKSLADEGMCVDINIHWKEGNHHAHIMGTTRPIKKNGEWGSKEKKAYKLDDRGQKIPVIDPKTGEQKIGARGRKMWQRETVEANDWNRTEKIEEWRKRWADECNKFLDRDVQIDHRSYERQGKEQLPTVHEGYAAREIERKGGISERCQENRKIRENNRLLAELRSKIDQVKEKLQDLLKTKELQSRRQEKPERLKERTGPMKCVVSGKLAAPVKTRVVTLNPGRKDIVADFRLLLDDPRDQQGALKCRAWGRNAEYIGGLEKGDLITGTATVRSKDNEPLFVVTSIDRSNELGNDVEGRIKAYEAGKTKHIYKPEERVKEAEKGEELDFSSWFKSRREEEQERERWNQPDFGDDREPEQIRPRSRGRRR